MTLVWTMTALTFAAAQGAPSPATDIHLSNGIVEAIVSPAKARITFFGRPGGTNMLWSNPRPVPSPNGINHGGDRVLYSPQALWPQIRPEGAPDPTAINMPWTVIEQSINRIVLQSDWDSDLGVRMTRTVLLPDGRPELVQTYHLTRCRDNPFPVHIWTIAQVRPTGTVLMNLADEAPKHHGNAATDLLRSIDEDESIAYFPKAQALRFRWPTDRASKLGTFGTWIAWIEGTEGLLISAPWVREDAFYFDRSNLQVFVLPGPRGFMELETQTPTTMLSAKESLEHVVRWRLLSWKEPPAQNEELAKEITRLAGEMTP